MKKIASKHVNADTGEEMINIEVNVDELDEEQEYMVQQAVEELTRYILRMKGIISPGCGGCVGC
jgi:hypothetical protein